MVQPVPSPAQVNSAVKPVTDTQVSSRGSSRSLRRILFHTCPGSLVLAGPFCGKLHGLHVTSCGAKAQSDTLVLRSPDSGDSRCEISWNHGAQQDPPSLELCTVSFNDDSWAFQDLGDRTELTSVTVKGSEGGTEARKTHLGRHECLLCEDGVRRHGVSLTHTHK